MDTQDRDPYLIKDWLRYWLNNKIKMTRKQTTQERYEGIIEKYLVPHMGDVALRDLPPSRIEAMERQLIAAGLAPRSVRSVHTVLSGAYRDALRLDLVSRNPVAGVTPPSIPRTRVMPPSIAVVQALLSLAQKEYPYLYPFLRLLVYTGMRRGEALAVRWSNVNLADRYLVVVESAVKTHRFGTVITSPKSADALRTIDLDDGTVAMLREHLASQLSEGDWSTSDGLVFRVWDGGVLKPSNIARHLKDMGERVGYPEITFHSLRHFHASVALQQKQNITVVSKRLGHANVTTTLSTYAHSMPGWQRATADAFAEAMERPC